MRRLALTLLLLLGAALFFYAYHLAHYLTSGIERPSLRADLVRVDKSARRMELLHKGEVIGSYYVSFGASPKGHKRQEGDERTPEGRYVIDWRNPRSKFYKSLHISYPNAQDRREARKRGVSPGGAIMIHGMPNGWGWAAPFLVPWHWTDGCIAVSNRQMDEIWNAVADGTPIEILP